MLAITKDARRMHGGSQSRLMLASDGNLYVVKFQGNPQGTLVLANELLASRVAEQIGLSVPRVEVLHLPESVADALRFEADAGTTPVLPGRQCGSMVPVTTLTGRIYEFLPQSLVRLVRNPEHFVGATLFDIWICNCDRRQILFWKRSIEKKFTVSFIDNGHCFGGPNWRIPSVPVPEWSPVEVPLSTIKEWLDRIESVTIADLRTYAEEIPPEWYEQRTQQLNGILGSLITRQKQLRAAMRFGRYERPDIIWSTNRADDVYKLCRTQPLLS